MTAERVITVEYLHSSMSQDLLCKFPDSSAFDFNYTESGIWSPLLPRGGRRSSHEEKHSDGSKMMIPSESLRRSAKGRMGMRRKKKKAMNAKKLDFSPKPTPKRGWSRLLKAAAKRFKMQRRAAIQMMLPTL